MATDSGRVNLHYTAMFLWRPLRMAHRLHGYGSRTPYQPPVGRATPRLTPSQICEFLADSADTQIPHSTRAPARMLSTAISVESVAIPAGGGQA